MTRSRHNPTEYPGLPFIGMEHVEAHSMRLLGTVPAHMMRSSAIHFWPEDVLYGRLRPYLNKIYRPDFEGLCSAEFIVIPSSKHLDNRYLQYVLNSSDFVTFSSHLNEGDRPRVDFEQLAPYPLKLPPLHEQHRIVAAIEQQFTRLDAAVAELEQARARLKRYRVAVLAAACAGRLVASEAALARAEGRDFEPAGQLLHRILKKRRTSWDAVHLDGRQPKGTLSKRKGGNGRHEEPRPPDPGSLSEVPDGWCSASVEQLASPEPRSIQSGPFGSALLHSEFTNQGILAIGIDNVQAGRFSMGREHRISERKFQQLERFVARPLDVLVTVMATVGRCCVVPADLETAIITKHVYRITADRNVVNPRYLMISMWGGEKVREQLFGQVQGQTRPGLNGEILRRIVIPLPPLVEQHRIVAEVERRLSVVDGLESTVAANITRAERLRQAILVQAFAGKLVPQDPTDEPASALLERIRAERAAEMSQTRTRRSRVTRHVHEQKSERRSLDAVLAEHPEGLDPLRLLRLAGFDEDSVDEFYAQLKVGIAIGKVAERRISDDEVILGAPE